MRLLILLLILTVISLACGPNVTETTAISDNKVHLSGKVVYVDSQGRGAPEVWVIISTDATDSADAIRLDSTMTDTLGVFLLDEVATISGRQIQLTVLAGNEF